jgi:glycosyltransferase involved in cell wall biosynthesis
MQRIVHINNSDDRGGAARIVMDVHLHALHMGLESHVLVGHRSSDCPHVTEFSRVPNTTWGRLVYHVSGGVARRTDAIGKAMRAVAEPRRYAQSALCRYLGISVFDYPWTHRISQAVPWRPEIIHLHNVHGAYFDLRALPGISNEWPVVMTLHDMWLLTGGCAHSLDCQQWKTGCTACGCRSGGCPSRRRTVAHNWRVKKSILHQCRLHIITPSQWLMDQVLQSHIGKTAVGTEVIHNGVDTAVFCPGRQGQARVKLGLPPNAWVLLFCANNAKTNPWKDYASVRKAAAVVAQRIPAKRTILIVMGDQGGDSNDEMLEIRHIPYVSDANKVADYYRAADLYLHAAHADTFPTTVLESLACGTPVVATAIGGIPEQVKSLRASVPGTLGQHTSGSTTGILVRHGDPIGMAGACVHLLRDIGIRSRMSVQAVRDVVERFTIERQVSRYIEFYERTLAEKQERTYVPST